MTLHNTDNVSLIFSACIPWWSNEQADRGNLPSGDTWEIGKYVDIVIPLVYDGIGHTVDDIVLRVSDEIIERPTVVGINAKEFASYEELLSTIQNLDSFYANNSNYLGCSIFEYRSLLELYKLKESHSVYPLIGRGLQAIDALENGVLESANLADSRTLGAAIQGLKTAISLIPVPATKLAVKVTGKLAKFTIKELVAWIMEQQIDVDTLHEFYLQGYFSDTMTEMRKEIISLDPDLQQYKDIFPADAEFVVDLQAYLDYVQQVGTNYPAQLSNLIEAHEARKEEMLVNDLIILGGGIALIVVKGGTGTPVLFYSAFDKSYTLVTGINDIEEEVELYYCLVATCHRQSDEAIYYANQIAKGLQYISEKIKTNDFSFPKITVTPFADGGALVKNDCHKAVRVKVEHLVTLRTEIPPDSIPPSPEALETHQYGNTYELSLGMGEEVFFLKPPPPDSIEEWIDKVSRWNLKIEETVLIRVFYGEEETGPVALKSCLSKCDYLVHEEYDETIKDYGTMEGTTAAIIDIKVEGQEISSEVVAKIRDLDIQIEAQPNKVIVKVGSVKEKGRTITINIDKTVLSIEEINEVSVLYDGKEIKLADNYTDVLNPNDEHNPEYLVLIGAEGIQVLVSIPNFSTHTITVAKRTVAYNIFSWFNQILFGIPIIGDIVRFLDTIIPGYGSLLFIIISVASLILLVVLMSKLK